MASPSPAYLADLMPLVTIISKSLTENVNGKVENAALSILLIDLMAINVMPRLLAVNDDLQNVLSQRNSRANCRLPTEYIDSPRYVIL